MSTARSTRFGKNSRTNADLAHHRVDLGVARGPVDRVPAVRVLALVDVDLHGGEAHVADAAELLLGLRVVRVLRLRVAVDADLVPHLAAEKLVDRQPERLARQIPECDLDAAQRRHVLTGLRAREDAEGPDALEKVVHVQGVLSDQDALHGPVDERRRADRGVGCLALPDEPLIGVDADVDLGPVRQHLRGAHVGDLQLRTAVGRARLLDGTGQAGQAKRAAEHAETAEEGPS